jgi:outer membrane lipoprotein carrier protein
VTDVPTGDRATTPLLFLAGQGDLQRDFDAELQPTDGDDRWVLGLTPRRPEPEYTRLTIAVDRRSTHIVGLTALDAQGGSSAFTFSNIRENTGVRDDLFTFKVPRGVDVITDGRPSSS